MNEKDAARLVELQAQIKASQLARQLVREDLIERLGDHMCCGSGGPTRADLKALARARRNVAQAQGELAWFLTVSTLAALGRPSGPGTHSKSFKSPRDSHPPPGKT
jgi:hypothetical protein